MIKIKISDKLRNTYRVEDGVCIVFAWCIEQFGRPFMLGRQAGRWNTDTYTTFYFRDEKDATLFALRWGSE